MLLGVRSCKRPSQRLVLDGRVWPWSIYNTDHSLRCATDSMLFLPTRAGWLNSQDPGDAGSMLTAGMVEGSIALINEIRLNTEFRGIHDSLHCLRREMELAMRSLAGAMVPHNLRMTLEQLRHQSPCGTKDARYQVERFLDPWKSEVDLEKHCYDP